MVDNRVGDNHGISIQAGVIHGPVTVNPPPADARVPGWVDTALPVHRCDASELGVHHALTGPENEGTPPYVARDVDAELDRRLAAVAAAPRGGLVLVAGASTAGKTRTLAAALARTLPDRMLVAPPEDADLRHLPVWLKERAARAPQGWVLWLDDLDRHLNASGLTPALVAELGQAGALVAATIRHNQLEALRPGTADHASGAEGAGYTVLKPPPVVIERRWNPHERERARASGDERLVRSAADERFGVAEQLAAGPVLEPIWRGGPDSGHPRGYALVAAAVALAQAGVSSPLTREQLHAAHSAYLPAPPPLPEEADQAWAWATRPRSGLAGLLVPADHDGRWRAFDYLTLRGPLPEAVWRAALDTAFAQDRFDVGLTAYNADRADIAEAAYLPLAKLGHPGSMFVLGVLLKEAGRVEEAESWYRRAAEQGHTEAMANLGLLLEEAGRVEEAESWYRQGAGSGHPGLMANLGLLLEKAGRVEEAESWYRQGADQNNTEAMHNLGVLLKEAGLLEEAESWYRRAAGQGTTEAMFSLGVLLEKVGRGAEAEDWWRRAAEQDHVEAMYNLGVLLKETGLLEEALTWYLRAAEQGHASAKYNLGVVLEKAGRVEEAENWYLQAAGSGHTNAMYNLGVLLYGAGRDAETEDWWRRAADQDHIEAMHNLGVLLEEAGREAEAESWYLRAAAARARQRR